MTTAYHSYKLENLHPFCEYDFIVSTQIEPKMEYETLNSTRFISSGVQAKGKMIPIIPRSNIWYRTAIYHIETPIRTETNPKHSQISTKSSDYRIRGSCL